MKKTIAVLCSLAIMLVCVGGCGAAGENPFAAENAIKGQVGDLYYVVPENAVLDGSSTDENTVYRVPIANSNEDHTLSIAYSKVDDEEYEAALKIMKATRDSAIAANNDGEEEIILHEDVDITEFLGKPVDYGFKITVEGNGNVVTLFFAVTSNEAYAINYSAKTGFYDQAVWDNFYAQLKFV